jgi:hypothetical protein
MALIYERGKEVLRFTTLGVMARMICSETVRKLVMPLFELPVSSNSFLDDFRLLRHQSGTHTIPATPPINVHTDAAALGPGPYFYRSRVER